MPQIFQVLRCYKCAVFQIHQSRKDNKWVCKVCGEKQSLKRHYGIGTAKDCRLHVQRLNVKRCENEKIKIYNSEDSDADQIVEEISIIDNEKSKQLESKWSIYLVDKQKENVTGEAEFLNDSEVVLGVPQKRKTKGKNLTQTKHFKALNNSCNYAKSNININTDETEINVLDPVINIHQNKDNCFNTIDDSNNVIEKPQFKTANSNYQKIKNSSKWAHYVQDDEEKNTDENNIENCYKSTLFLMCDDSDLDNILDI